VKQIEFVEDQITIKYNDSPPNWEKHSASERFMVVEMVEEVQRMALGARQSAKLTPHRLHQRLHYDLDRLAATFLPAHLEAKRLDTCSELGNLRLS
jgi:hypothetical protein